MCGWFYCINGIGGISGIGGIDGIGAAIFYVLICWIDQQKSKL